MKEEFEVAIPPFKVKEQGLKIPLVEMDAAPSVSSKQETFVVWSTKDSVKYSKFNCTVSLWAGQPLFPVEVKIKLTNPIAISAAEGEYKVFKLVLFGKKTPVPPVQIPPEAICTIPFKGIFSAARAQSN